MVKTRGVIDTMIINSQSSMTTFESNRIDRFKNINIRHHSQKHHRQCLFSSAFLFLFFGIEYYDCINLNVQYSMKLSRTFVHIGQINIEFLLITKQWVCWYMYVVVVVVMFVWVVSIHSMMMAIIE